MKRNIISLTLCLCLVLCGCITEYEAKGIEEVKDILVVEGLITDNETAITLSLSVNLTGAGYGSISSSYNGMSYVNNAEVYVECDDGRQFHADTIGNRDDGRYTIKTGLLDLDSKYRLNIKIEEHEYFSDYSYPIKTPEIDSIFWTKRGLRQPVNIYVSTRDSAQQILYYRWWYQEDWEINSPIPMAMPNPLYPSVCWNKASNREILIGSTDRSADGILMQKIIEITPSDRRLSSLYRIDVKQIAISKRSHDYYENIRKNNFQTGSIFAPVPSELRGNILCATDPNRPVIGYVDVSLTVRKQRFISRSDALYEPPFCPVYTRDAFTGEISADYININQGTMGEALYAPITCVDCSLYGREAKPDDWPN